MMNIQKQTKQTNKKIKICFIALGAYPLLAGTNADNIIGTDVHHVILAKELIKQDLNIPKLVEDMNLKEDVILIPSQPHEEVPKYLSAFDILCCPKIDCEINRAASPVIDPCISNGTRLYYDA